MFPRFQSLSACSDVVKNDQPEAGALRRNAVSVLYYPAEFHTELVVGDKVFSPYDRFNNNKSFSSAVRKVESGGSGFIRFGIALRDDESARLDEFIKARQGKETTATCVSGSCEALGAAGFFVPPPFNIHPTANAFYLSALHLTGMSRVKDVASYGVLRPSVFDTAVVGTASATAFLEAGRRFIFAPESWARFVFAGLEITSGMLGLVALGALGVYALMLKTREP